MNRMLDTCDPSLVLPSWERRDELGFGKAYSYSCQELLFNTATTFEQLSPKNDVVGSMLFAVIGMVCPILAIAQLELIALLASLAQNSAAATASFVFGAALRASTVVLMLPVVVLVWVVLVSALYQLSCRFYFKRSVHYTLILRMVSYATGSCLFSYRWLILIPPLFGWLFLFVLLALTGTYSQTVQPDSLSSFALLAVVFTGISSIGYLVGSIEQFFQMMTEGLVAIARLSYQQASYISCLPLYGFAVILCLHFVYLIVALLL